MISFCVDIVDIDDVKSISINDRSPYRVNAVDTTPSLGVYRDSLDSSSVMESYPKQNKQRVFGRYIYSI